MDSALLFVGVFFSFWAATALRPPHWPGLGAVLFFPSWLARELPLHVAAFGLCSATMLAAAGGLDTERGLLGFAMTAGAVFALLVFARRTMPRQIEWRRVAGVLPFRPHAVHRMRNVVYVQRGRRALHLDIFRPRIPGEGPRPCLLYVHGGGWVIGDKSTQGLPTVHELTAAGWVCFSMNYRKSPRATYPEHLIDVKRAIAWIRTHGASYGADPNFLVLAGGSAGGHLAALAALTPNVPELQPDDPGVDTQVQGCVSFYGVYDLTERSARAGHRMMRLLLELLVIKRRFAANPELFEQASPIANVGPHAPPFLVVHGDRDTLVPVESARAFVARLRQTSRAPVEYLEVAGAQHAFEIFHTYRSIPTVRAVCRFCAGLHSAYVQAQSAARIA